MTDLSAASATTELMNRIYRRQRHVYDATRKFYLLGRDQLIDRLNARPGDNVLEIGCGTGRNLILAAQRYPGARFFGIDVSTDMLETAITAIGHAGQSSRVRVAHADAAAIRPVLRFGVENFDRIFISYSLSMIGPWEKVLDWSLAHLAADGELHIVDFGGQAELPGWFRAGLRRWLTLFHVIPRDRLADLLVQQAQASGATVMVERMFRDYSIYVRVKV